MKSVAIGVFALHKFVVLVQMFYFMSYFLRESTKLLWVDWRRERGRGWQARRLFVLSLCRYLFFNGFEQYFGLSDKSFGFV